MSERPDLGNFLKSQDGAEKVASNGSASDGKEIAMIDKLAAFSSDIETFDKQATSDGPGEGSVQENNKDVAEPSKEVDSVTDAVINPQVELGSPGAIQEAEAGDKPISVPADEPIVSHGMGKVTDSKTIGILPESVELAEQATNKKTAAQQFAHDFNDELEKIAEIKEAMEARGFLKTAGLLEKYDFSDLEKTASDLSDHQIMHSIFTKMAKGEPIANVELIAAADFYGDNLEKEAEATYEGHVEIEAQEQFEKEAADAEAQQEEVFKKHADNPKTMESIAHLKSVELM